MPIPSKLELVDPEKGIIVLCGRPIQNGFLFLGRSWPGSIAEKHQRAS